MSTAPKVKLYTAAFIFEPGEYDDEFHRLDAEIEAFAQSLSGFAKTERWISPDQKVRNSVYYFTELAAIGQLESFAPHKEAKANYKKWYRGYRIEISEVTTTYGDGNL